MLRCGLWDSTADISEFTDLARAVPTCGGLRERVTVVRETTLTEMQARVMIGDQSTAHDLAIPEGINRHAPERVLKKPARWWAHGRDDVMQRHRSDDDLPRFAQLVMS